MKNSLLNYQFFKSYRLPLESNDKVFADIFSTTFNSGACRQIEIESINLSGLNFTSKSYFPHGEDVEIQIFTKRLFNNWDFTLKGKIVRSFISESKKGEIVYGVLLERQNKDSVLNYFLKDFLNRYSEFKLIQNIQMACSLSRNVEAGESVELFSLFNSIIQDFQNLTLENFLQDLQASFRCENYHLFLFNHSKNKLVSYRSSCEENLLKTEMINNIYMIYENGVISNLSFKENEKSINKTKTFLGYPVYNSKRNIVGVIALTNTLNGSSFSAFQESCIRLISQIISYHIKDFATNINFDISQKEIRSDLFIGQNRTSLEIKNSADLLRNVTKNIFILGEQGSRKHELANYLHETGKFKSDHIKQINFTTKEKIDEFFKNIDNNELFDKGTIIINEVGNLNHSQQIKLYDFLKNLNMRVISLSSKEIYFRVKNGEFSKKLYFFIADIYIHIPPLRNRKNDILEISDIILNEEQEKRGFAVSSFNEIATRNILEYNWPGNLTELRNEIKKSVIRSNGKETLEMNLKRHTSDYKAQKNKLLFNLLKSIVKHSDKSIDYKAHSETLNYYIRGKKSA